MTFVLSLLLLAAEAPPKAKPLATVLEVEGRVELQPAKGKPRPLQEGDLLFADDQLTAKDKSHAILYFDRDKHKEQLKADNQAKVAPDGCTPANAVERKELGPEKKAVPGLPEISGSGPGTVTVIRSPPSGKKPAVTPIAEARILTDKPTFTWEAVPQAKGYLVQIKFVSGTRRVWKEEHRTKNANLPYPANEKPLPRGREYLWEVLYETPDGLLKGCAAGGFYTANPDEVAQMEKVRLLAESDKPADLFLAALTYDHQQYYAEALAVYERLCRLRPEKGGFQAARAALYEQAGRPEEAKRAWAEAEKAGFVRPSVKGASPVK